jgi:hypothetical protein
MKGCARSCSSSGLLHVEKLSAALGLPSASELPVALTRNKSAKLNVRAVRVGVAQRAPNPALLVPAVEWRILCPEQLHLQLFQRRTSRTSCHIRAASGARSASSNLRAAAACRCATSRPSAKSSFSSRLERKRLYHSSPRQGPVSGRGRPSAGRRAIDAGHRCSVWG